MPSDQGKQKIEMEIAIKDSFSVMLKEMGKQLDAVNKKAQEIGGTTTTGAISNFRKQNEALTESAKRGNIQLSAMSGILTTMGRTLSIGGGIAYGAYMKSARLSKVYRMQNFARDTGFTTKARLRATYSLRRSKFQRSFRELAWWRSAC
jgi:hypothetical protein